jgi:hypothetical protein
LFLSHIFEVAAREGELLSRTTTAADDTTIMTTGEAPSRAALRGARRVCIKAGTSVVTNENGKPSLTRLGAIAEQIGELHARGIQVIFVSSGSVGMGKRLLRKQNQMTMSFKDMHESGPNIDPVIGKDIARNHSFASLLNETEPPHTYAQKKKVSTYYYPSDFGIDAKTSFLLTILRRYVNSITIVLAQRLVNLK